jgi:hypothetical protein
MALVARAKAARRRVVIFITMVSFSGCVWVLVFVAVVEPRWEHANDWEANKQNFTTLWGNQGAA